MMVGVKAPPARKLNKKPRRNKVARPGTALQVFRNIVM
jgi:hypothetical protein